MPPPATAAKRRGHRRRTCRCPSATATRARAPRPARSRSRRGTGRDAARAAAVAQPITIKTDLYTADIDTGRRRDRARRARPRTATSIIRSCRIMRCCRRPPSAPSSRSRGCSAPGCRTTAPSTRLLPGPRELAAGADSLELKLQATARQRRQGRADADLPPRQLRDRRRLRRHQRAAARRSRPSRISS